MFYLIWAATREPTKWPVRPTKTQITLVWSVFAIRMKTPCVLRYPLSTQRRLWSDWASMIIWVFAGCTCHFAGFVVLRLICRKMFFSHTNLWQAAPVSDGLRTLILSALNHSSSHRCGFEPSSGHMWDKLSSACGWSDSFSQGCPVVFAQAYDWLGSKWVK